MKGYQDFEQTVKQVLRTQSVDVATLQRLDAARREAVAASGSRRPWQPFAAAASLALAALVATFLMIPPDAPPLSDGAEDIDLLLAEESIELFEDMEFYQWLSLESDAS